MHLLHASSPQVSIVPCASFLQVVQAHRCTECGDNTVLSCAIQEQADRHTLCAAIYVLVMRGITYRNAHLPPCYQLIWPSCCKHNIQHSHADVKSTHWIAVCNINVLDLRMKSCCLVKALVNTFSALHFWDSILDLPWMPSLATK